MEEKSRPVTIGLVGAGNIGSRHLQALAHLVVPANVVAVDPSAASRELASARFQEVYSPACKTVFSIHDSLSALPEYLDVAIIATDARVRVSIIERLLANHRVKHLIVEKVLFQTVGDCIKARRILEQSGTPTWVNCPRRMVPLYSDIRDSLRGESRVGFTITGSNWGLGCNGVHFLDLLIFLTGRSDICLSGARLDSGTVAARRPGFLEFTGSLDGTLERDVCFVITSYARGNAPVTLYCESPNVRWLVTEAGSSVRGWRAAATEGWEWSEVDGYLPFQSQLTNLVVQELLSTAGCPLPNLAQALCAHVPFLRALNRHLCGPAATDETVCPIT